jgi:hypothetical protein
MTPLFLLISLGLIWINLAGLGLITARAIGDYAVSRIASLLGFCLLFFFFEHYHGLGPKLWFLPVSTAFSVWISWNDRKTLRDNWVVEAAFGVGLAYCLTWRYAFPDIDLFGERIPDLVFIQDYIKGTVLPAPDRWMPPFDADFYYSFQFYAAALMGRWFRLDPSLCYQFGYCITGGLISCAIFTAARRLGTWKPGAWLITTALLIGGCGLGLVIHLAMKEYLQPLEMARYLGIPWGPEHRTAFGVFLDRFMYYPNVTPLEMPVEPLSFVLTVGEFHPPLIGFVIMTLSVLIIATVDTEMSFRRRDVYHALLAATIPLSLIGNTWVFPLQTIIVLGWFAYRSARGEHRQWLAGLYGAGIATTLAYPFIVNFIQESALQTTQIRITTKDLHATLVEWLSVFWPLVLLVILSAWNKEKRGLSLYFAGLAVVLMLATEFLYIHDINSGSWERYNSTLKWWGWVYTVGVLGMGALNLGARSRFCRYASLVVLLLPCAQAYDFGRFFLGTPKDSLGQLDGTYWLTRDTTIRDMVSSLKARPDGVSLDSQLTFDNTDASVINIFADKQCYMGWPVQEGIWRAFRGEIRYRVQEIDDFYGGKMADPLDWLLKNNIRYVMWLQRDNDHNNERFVPLWNKIRSHYAWRHYAGNDGNWSVGFWERVDPTPAGP